MVLVWAAVVAFSGAEAASEVGCGDTITTDTTLHHNLVNCPNNGIVIGADNVTLDLNYHTIDGDGTPAAGCDPQTEFCDTGIVNFGHDGVTVMHGSLREFDGRRQSFRAATAQPPAGHFHVEEPDCRHLALRRLPNPDPKQLRKPLDSGPDAAPGWACSTRVTSASSTTRSATTPRSRHSRSIPPTT